MAQSPCFYFPFWFPFASLLFPFTYLETLLGVIGSRPPWPQVTRKLTSPFSTPPHSLPIPNSQNPRLIVRLTTMTSWSRLLMVRNTRYILELSAESGVSTSVRHLQAHVSYLLIHMSDHASTQFGFGCQVVSYSGFALSPFSQLKHGLISDFMHQSK